MIILIVLLIIGLGGWAALAALSQKVNKQSLALNKMAECYFWCNEALKAAREVIYCENGDKAGLLHQYRVNERRLHKSIVSANKDIV